jgi:3-oxoadipate enol-lactonase
VKLLAHDRIAPQGSGTSAMPRPPLLLVHGIGGGRRLWLQGLGAQPGLAQQLAALGHEVVAVDLPGYGDSVALQGIGPGTPADMAQALASLIDGLHLGPVVVVGHSLGGMVALELAATQPRCVAGLVLACSSAAFGRPEGDWQARFVAERLAPLNAGLGMAALARQLVPGMLPTGSSWFAEQAIAVMQAVPEDTYRTVLQGIVSFDRRALLPSIAVPVLCLAGTEDRTSPPKVLRGMAERIAAARYAEVAAGHLAPFEAAEAFVAAVSTFLQSYPRANQPLVH